MPFLAPILPILSAVATVAGTAVSVVGANKQASAVRSQAVAVQQAANIQAANQRSIAEAQALIKEKTADFGMQQAGQEIASSQRAALDQKRLGRLVGSKAQSISAASGAGSLDPTITGILGDLDTEAEARAMTAIFEGKTRASVLEGQAAVDRDTAALYRKTGDIDATSTLLNADLTGQQLLAKSRQYRNAGIGSILSGAGTLFDKYADEYG